MSEPALTHLDAQGRARMVDVSAKPITTREAVAEGFIAMRADVLALIASGQTPKGDVLATARIAGIMAAKRTSELVPLCHPLPLSSVKVGFHLREGGIAIDACVRTAGQTGVEMEALTAVSVAALTLYDMGKALDRDMVIGDIRLIRKSGGASGDYERS